MSSEPKNLETLQSLEIAVVKIWREHREMSDHVAARAYEAAFERYRAEARGHQPKPCTFSGLDREIFEAVQQICEHRLGRAVLPQSEVKPVAGIPVSELVECWRELRNSVERHTRISGRQGYLSFISQFVPV